MEQRMMWRLEVYNQHHHHQNNQHQHIIVITTIAVTLIVMKNLMVFISHQLEVSLPRTRRRWTRSMPSTTTPRSLSLLGIKVIFTLIQVNKTLHPSFSQVLRPVDRHEEERERKEVGEVRGDRVGGQGASAYSKITGVAVTPTLDGAPSS